jgi:Na+-translocating ferredoxin:NAD+ oxidoreductase subunit B
MSTSITADQIDALLPQTQCTKCGYQGCRPYAEAIAAGDAEINRCPPGGEPGIQKLSQLLGRPALPLDSSCGEHLPHRVAVIDEDVCIGCAKCLKPCPTDAIIGANKFMHTVLPQFCSACELCIPACPVDCITMIDDPRYPTMFDANLARERFRFHNFRLTREVDERSQLLAARESQALARLNDGDQRG